MNLGHATESNGIFSLAKGSFIGNSRLGSKLVLRQCYRDLWQEFLSAVYNGTGKGIVVTGNPGIGKSWFLYWVLYQAKMAKINVVTQNVVKEPNLILFSGDSVRFGSYTDFASLLRNP